MKQALVPYDDRGDQVYILAKRLKYIAEAFNPAWAPQFYEAVTNATGITFVLGANSDGEVSESSIPAGVLNHGVLDQKEFLKAVSQSLALLGVGHPPT